MQKLNKATKQAIKQAPDDRAIALTLAAQFLNVGYDWAWELKKAGILVAVTVEADPAGAYVSAASLRAYRRQQKENGTRHQYAKSMGLPTKSQDDLAALRRILKGSR